MTSGWNSTSSVFNTETIFQKNSSDFFFPLMAIMLFFFGLTGYFLHAHNPSVVSIFEEPSRLQQTHFIIDEKKPVLKQNIPEKKEVKKVADNSEVIDLTRNPLPAQEKNETADASSSELVQKPVRRVYGLKKVYSTGIGASGNVSDAIIGKLGNTLETDIDTIKATKSDLVGTPVSITTVTTFPRLKNTVKPEYTKEMIEHRIEGIVRVRVVVDVDGKVKQVIVLDDLGYGSKTKVAEACFKMTFEPAMIEDKPVATVIMMRIRFEMLDG